MFRTGKATFTAQYQLLPTLLTLAPKVIIHIYSINWEIWAIEHTTSVVDLSYLRNLLAQSFVWHYLVVSTLGCYSGEPKFDSHLGLDAHLLLFLLLHKQLKAEGCIYLFHRLSHLYIQLLMRQRQNQQLDIKLAHKLVLPDY